MSPQQPDVPHVVFPDHTKLQRSEGRILMSGDNSPTFRMFSETLLLCETKANASRLNAAAFVYVSGGVRNVQFCLLRV